MAASDSTAAASVLQEQYQTILETTSVSMLERHKQQRDAAAKIHHEFASLQPPQFCRSRAFSKAETSIRIHAAP
jgi:predicted subunit of tRNA(5-methylaminomethyl-2-thiouridylate) methyltransferase